MIRVEPAHTQAFCTITKEECAYPRIMAAYDAVDTWIRQSGLPPAGPPREVYFADFCDLSDTDPCAHVARPVNAERNLNDRVKPSVEQTWARSG